MWINENEDDEDADLCKYEDEHWNNVECVDECKCEDQQQGKMQDDAKEEDEQNDEDVDEHLGADADGMRLRSLMRRRTRMM